MRSELFNIDCLDFLKTLPDASVDVICTDPPYKYLNHKLDRDFNEIIFFDEAVRVLKDGGWIIIFGRGTSFYRWNVMLAERGMNFKEEVIWNKRYVSSPLLPLSRMHETISLSCKGSGKILRSRFPYTESQIDLSKMQNDINKLKTVLSNAKNLENVQRYLKGEGVDGTEFRGNGLNIHSDCKRYNACASVMKIIEEGKLETSIIPISRDQYTSIHPTQKPVRLIERLLLLVTRGGLVLDPFSGSGSCRIACHNLGLDFIGCEIDEEYYAASEERYKIEVNCKLL